MSVCNQAGEYLWHAYTLSGNEKDYVYVRGFVEMASTATANAAKEKFNGHSMHGKPLNVNDAKPKTER